MSLLIFLKMIVSYLVPTLALLISFLSLYKTRSTIDIYWSSNHHLADKTELVASDDPLIPASLADSLKSSKTGKKNTQLGFLISNAVLIQLQAINTSPNDIGFFNLKFTDNSGNLITCYTQDTLRDNRVKHVLRKSDAPNTQWVPINIPPTEQGIFKAHSYQIWNVIIPNIESTKSITASITLTKKTWWKLWGESYKTYTKTYSL